MKISEELTLVRLTAPTTDSDYSRLIRQIRDAGLLKRRPLYYAISIAINVLLFAAGWMAFFWLGDSWLQLTVAVCLAVTSAQLGFLGHELGHRQVFRTRRMSDVVGVVNGNLAIGLSYSWWTDKHNRHHSHPNQIGLDSDVAAGALVWTPEQAEKRHGIGRWWAKWQARARLSL